MSKHSTTPRTLSRRLAALLAALALLAAMALPVYADALDSATGTAQAEIGNTISDGTVTTENDSTTPEGKEAAEDSTANADGNNASENKDTKDNASSSTTGDSTTPAGDAVPSTGTTQPSSTDNTAPTVAGENKNNTNDTTSKDSSDNSESPEDVQLQDDGEAGDISLATESGEETFAIYFAAPSSWGNGDYQVYFNARKVQNSNDFVYLPMEKIETLNYPDRNVYKVDLTNSTDCPSGCYYKLEFCKKENGKEDWIHVADSKTDKSVFANSLYDYDGSNGTWVKNYQTFDRDNHKSFAGKTMFFQNQSNTNLANVQAVFYEKTDNDWQTVSTIDLEAIEAGKHASFTIPNENCSYIEFIVDNNKTPRYSFYGQQDGGETDKFFTYDSAKAFCYVYQTNDSGSWTTLQGGNRVYFDATFSKLKTNSANDTGGNYSIPAADSTSVYYRAKGEGVNSVSGLMTQDSPNSNLYYVELNDAYTEIAFSQKNLTSDTINAPNGQSTAWQTIPQQMENPCFYADTYDDSVYGKGPRSGYWDKKGEIRDAENGKGKTNDPVVDVPSADFTPESNTKYINTTLYDYYTDWELNGNNRDKYKGDNGASQRNWVTFRQFDQALSDYYQSDKKQTVLYPIYTGHFQPNEMEGDKHFSEVASALNLYGWDKYNTFMAVNNSYIDINGNKNLANPNNKDDKNNYVFTFQGLVSGTLNKDGNPTLYNTDLAEPHFNKAFLEGANSKKAVLGKVYENVDFPFTKKDVFGNNINYWHYESNDKSLFLKQKEGTADQYFLQQPAETVVNDKMVSNNAQNLNSSSDHSGTYGFFPFNENSTDKCANTYNYGFGAKLQFDFTLTDDGTVLDNSGNKVPIQFFFSGDDDVWVYIDNELALDVGGAHGEASGLLEFGTNKAGKLVYTPYVSKVKTGNEKQSYEPCGTNNVKKINYLGEPIEFNYKGNKDCEGNQKEISAGKHTLKFFYMERGMWESNMAIAFNFPDHNELQVEKNVDIREVDPDFKACFTNQKLFNFTILNQATHYGPKAVEEGSVQQVPPKKLSSNDYNTLGRMGDLQNDDKNYCKLDDDPDTNNTGNNTGQVIHWYAEYDDTHSDYRKERMGVITLKESVDITGMDYLSFYIYASGQKGEGTLSLSNMYLQLVDHDGNVLGCNDKESLSGTTYNQVDLKNDEWIKIKLDLSRLNVHGEFNKTKVVAIRIGDNFQRDIYFKDFTFTANPTIKKITGFTTEQKDIPDYGSAADGELKLAESAQFSSSIDGKTRAVDENGQFTLQDKEVVTFSDQFRRGSYLSVTEDADPALFDTTWTIYENGVSVKTMNSGKTVQNADQAPSVVEQPGYTPKDGRTEKTSTDIGLTGDGNSYKGEKPDGEAIVFRSYTNPDAGDAAELTKLKLQFVNKVKTGSLTIKKEAAAGEQGQIGSGEYTFTVTFANVGGLGLESKPIVKTVTINGTSSETIYGIPVGTRFHIVETKANNGANVSSVTFSGGGKDCKVVNGKEAIGSIVEGKTAIATFTNTTRTLIDIGLTKKWVDANNEPLADDKLDKLPRIIYVQLQRRTETDSEWKPVDVTGQTYVAVERDQGGWTHKFTNLDADDYTSKAETKPVYQYRVVEGTLETKDGSTTFKPVGDDGILIISGNAYKANSTTADKDNAIITLTNTRLNPKFTLDVTKKSAESDGENGEQKLLAGVEFTLERLTTDSNGETVVDSSFVKRKGVTNGQGELMLTDSSGNATTTKGFKELEAGTYRLTETKAAKDYNLLSEPIIISFSKDGKCKVGDDSPMQANDKKIFTGNAAEGYTLKLTVLNRKTPALPHTGADAPSLWLLIGLPLAVAGLLILVFRYNKKGGRTR